MVYDDANPARNSIWRFLNQAKNSTDGPDRDVLKTRFSGLLAQANLIQMIAVGPPALVATILQGPL
jgi:hypothetical protein